MMNKKICFICKQKDKIKNLKNYHYPFSEYYYHQECLEVAVCNANRFTNDILDLVIEITNDIKQQKIYRARLLIKCNKICKESKKNSKAPTGNPHMTM